MLPIILKYVNAALYVQSSHLIFFNVKMGLDIVCTYYTSYYFPETCDNNGNGMQNVMCLKATL